MNLNDRLLTPRETAQFLAISPRKLWELTRKGKIRATHVPPRNVRYDPEDVEAFIDDCKRQETEDKSIEDEDDDDDSSDDPKKSRDQ